MDPVIKCPLVFVLALCANTAAADRVITVEPGQWEYTHTLEIPGLLAPTTTPKSECISPSEAQRNLSDLMAELTADDRCSFSNLKSNLNAVSFDLGCDLDSDPVSLQSIGHLAFRYGRTNITGSASGMITIGGVDIAINATGRARRVGRCQN